MASGLNMVTLLPHLSVLLAHNAPATLAALPALETHTHSRALALAVSFQERTSSIFLHGLLPTLLLGSNILLCEAFPQAAFSGSRC